MALVRQKWSDVGTPGVGERSSRRKGSCLQIARALGVLTSRLQAKGTAAGRAPARASAQSTTRCARVPAVWDGSLESREAKPVGRAIAWGSPS